MKRTEALIPLSKDHHKALVTAKRINDLAEEAEVEIRNYWYAKREVLLRELTPHFETEEQTLLPLLKEISTDLSERLLSDHRLMLSMLRDEDNVQPIEFAELLKTHVRFEEREMFPLLEEKYGDSELLSRLKGEL